MLSLVYVTPLVDGYYLIILILCGCDMKESDNTQSQQQSNCNFQYAYSCGLDIMSGNYICGWGHYYVCH